MVSTSRFSIRKYVCLLFAMKRWVRGPPSLTPDFVRYRKKNLFLDILLNFRSRFLKNAVIGVSLLRLINLALARLLVMSRIVIISSGLLNLIVLYVNFARMLAL